MHQTFRRLFVNPTGCLLLLSPVIARLILWICEQLWEDEVVQFTHRLYERSGTRWLGVALSWYSSNLISGVVGLSALVMVALWTIAFIDDRQLARKGSNSGPPRRPPKVAPVQPLMPTPSGLDHIYALQDRNLQRRKLKAEVEEAEERVRQLRESKQSMLTTSTDVPVSQPREEPIAPLALAGADVGTDDRPFSNISEANRDLVRTTIESYKAAQDTNVLVSDTVTPEYLCKFYQKNMSIQADALAKPFIGKWMVLSGQVHEISFSSLGAAIPTVYLANYTVPLVSFIFQDDWMARLTLLPRGGLVVLSGQIKQITASFVILENCEIL